MAKQIVSSTLLSLILLTMPIISNYESHGSQFTAPVKASKEAFAVNKDGDKDGDKEKAKCKDKDKDKDKDKCRGGGEAVNKAPIVNAGPNQTIALPSSAS